MPMHNEINSLLSDDHIQIHEAFENLQHAVSQQKPMLSQQLLFHLFKSSLLKHLHWEETVLFPLYREITKQTVCPTSLMYVQHKEIVEFISTLETQQHTGFELATVKLLGDYLLKHNAYEEKILYPAIEELSHGMMKDKIKVAISRGYK